jgi:hypothetical protein
MKFNDIRIRILRALREHSGGSVYLKPTSVPSSYPAGIYEFTGFKGTKTSNSSGSKGNYHFELYIMEDVTDYAKSGDVWNEEDSSNFNEDTLKSKVDSLAKVLYGHGFDASEYDIYPASSAEKDLLIAKLTVKVVGRL